MKPTEIYTVYLVDDDKMTLYSLKNMIHTQFGESVSVHSFETGSSFLEQMEREVPDVVVLDYYLEVEPTSESQNGLDLLKKIKAKSPDTFVIMLSAQKREEVVFQAMVQGAFDFILKNERTFTNIITDITQCFKNISWIRTKRNVMWL